VTETDRGDFDARLRSAVAEAATHALRLEGTVANVGKSGETRIEKQALTRADLEVQEILLRALLACRPHVRLEAEEDTPTCALFGNDSDEVAIIDPIDGTYHSYLGGEGPYSVILGFAVKGVYRQALVALPREQLLFEGIAGVGARVGTFGGEGRPAEAIADGERILVSHGMPDAVCSALEASGFEVAFGSGGAVAVAPLVPGVRAGLRYAEALPGVSVRGRAGLVIARESGARVEQASGADFPNDMTTPARTLVIATSAEDSQRIREALRSAGVD